MHAWNPHKIASRLTWICSRTAEEFELCRQALGVSSASCVQEDKSEIDGVVDKVTKRARDSHEDPGKAAGLQPFEQKSCSSTALCGVAVESLDSIETVRV